MFLQQQIQKVAKKLIELDCDIAIIHLPIGMSGQAGTDY